MGVARGAWSVWAWPAGLDQCGRGPRGLVGVGVARVGMVTGVDSGAWSVGAWVLKFPLWLSSCSHFISSAL